MTTTKADMDRIAELLPFYVNGTLDRTERDAVEAAMQDDVELQEDVRTMALLRESMQDLETGTTPGEFGFARLMRDIDREEAAKPQESFFFKGLAVAAATAAFVIGIGWVTQPETDTFIQASGEATVEALTVAFRPEATQSEISAVLLDLGLEVAGGPSALGLYQVVAPGGGDLEELAGALRTNPEVVESVNLP